MKGFGLPQNLPAASSGSPAPPAGGPGMQLPMTMRSPGAPPPAAPPTLWNPGAKPPMFPHGAPQGAPGASGGVPLSSLFNIAFGG